MMDIFVTAFHHLLCKPKNIESNRFSRDAEPFHETICPLTLQQKMLVKLIFLHALKFNQPILIIDLLLRIH